MNTKTRPSTLHWQPALQRPEEYVCGLDDIHQAIHIILRTPRGSDPHRPLFGICELPRQFHQQLQFDSIIHVHKAS